MCVCVCVIDGCNARSKTDPLSGTLCPKCARNLGMRLLIDHVRAQNLHVVHIRDWHDASDPDQAHHLEQFGPHCIKSTPLAGGGWAGV